MNLKMFSIYDSAVNAYNQPFFTTTTGEAIRLFTNNVNDTQSLIHKNHTQFSLFEMGEMDTTTGEIHTHKHHPKIAVSATQVLESENVTISADDFNRLNETVTKLTGQLSKYFGENEPSPNRPKIVSNDT